MLWRYRSAALGRQKHAVEYAVLIRADQALSSAVTVGPGTC